MIDSRDYNYNTAMTRRNNTSSTPSSTRSTLMKAWVLAGSLGTQDDPQAQIVIYFEILPAGEKKEGSVREGRSTEGERASAHHQDPQRPDLQGGASAESAGLVNLSRLSITERFVQGVDAQGAQIRLIVGFGENEK